MKNFFPNLSRRNFFLRSGLIGGLAAMPGGRGLAAPAAHGKGGGAAGAQRDYFKELGLRPFINAAGTFTTLTASLMHPEVVQAIDYSSKHFVQLLDLHQAVGRRIASLIGCEDALVSAGAASALTLGTAACLTGTNQEFIRRLPDTTGMKTEVMFPLDPRRPLSHGPQIHPEQGPPLQLERARAMEDAIPVIREKTDEFARVFGRTYPHFVESYLLEDAELAIVISGGHAVTCRAAINRLRAQGIKIGMARLLWVRPFPSDDLRAALRGVKAVGVVETNLGLGGASYGGILSADVTTALYHLPGSRPLVTSFMAGLGGETVPMAEFDWMAGKLGQAAERGHVEKAAHWVGFED